MDEMFSDGSIQAEHNNRAYMASLIVARLRTIGQNVIAGAIGLLWSASGTLWSHGPEETGDGLLGTYWWADTTVSWLQVVLPFQQYLQRFQLHGYIGYYLNSFSVKLSPDGTTWTTIYEGGSTSTVEYDVRFRAMWARYIRIEIYDIYQCCGALNNYAVIREIEGYETANIASWRPGSSSGDRWGHLPYEAVDNQLGTYWWGTTSSGSWIRYDFPATCMAYYRLRLYEGYGVLQMEIHVFLGSTDYSYSWASNVPQVDLFGVSPITSCSITAFKIIFLDNAQGAYDDYPVVIELEAYYGE